MSDPVTALGGAMAHGFAEVCEAGLRGMIQLRCDLGAPSLVRALKALELNVPKPLATAHAQGRAVFWMSPDELLLTCAYDEAAALTNDLQTALTGTHSLVANVSDARAVFAVTGDGAGDVLRKLTPVDLDLMRPGHLRRSRLAQVAAAIHSVEATRYDVYVMRAHAQYAFDLLANAARPGSALSPSDPT